MSAFASQTVRSGVERDCIAKVTTAIRRASFQTITHLGAGQATVEKVASNRRYVGRDGRISFARTSATVDPTIRNQPEGLIDPALKTISFWNGRSQSRRCMLTRLIQ